MFRMFLQLLSENKYVSPEVELHNPHLSPYIENICFTVTKKYKCPLLIILKSTAENKVRNNSFEDYDEFCAIVTEPTLPYELFYDRKEMEKYYSKPLDGSMLDVLDPMYHKEFCVNKNWSRTTRTFFLFFCHRRRNTF